MSDRLYTGLLVTIAIAFTACFVYLVVPPLIQEPDIIGAFAAGFVNPYSSGYSLDVIFCWWILLVWVIHDARQNGIRHGWICVLLGVVPGVAVGLATYLLVRHRQMRLQPQPRSHNTGNNNTSNHNKVEA